jgi:hypothetical protein
MPLHISPPYAYDETGKCISVPEDYHGKTHTYNKYKCRCRKCTTKNTLRGKISRHENRERIKDIIAQWEERAELRTEQEIRAEIERLETRVRACAQDANPANRIAAQAAIQTLLWVLDEE